MEVLGIMEAVKILAVGWIARIQFLEVEGIIIFIIICISSQRLTHPHIHSIL
jgi:hypothetical protein